ncbi:MAG: S26 family signal peptidase [Gammaproteobacteria bacterium]
MGRGLVVDTTSWYLPLRRSTEWLLGCGVVCLTTATIVGAHQAKLVVSLTDSIKPIFLTRLPSEPERGDYVLVQVIHKAFGPRPTLLSKRYMCGPGDVLKMELEERYAVERVMAPEPHVVAYCNGSEITSARAVRGHDGTIYQPFRFDGIVPDGKAFVQGDIGSESFDSRYIGFVNFKKMTKLKVRI